MENGLSNGRDPLVKAERTFVREEAVKIPAGSVPRTAPQPAPADDPEVSVVKADDGTIRVISVRCTCGREITLHCEYLREGGDDDREDS